jgi:lycopene beta-cyclase
MVVRHYDVLFVGGLAAMLLLKELQPMLPERVAVIDPCSLLERPLLHWSYWSHEQTFYDRFAISAWQRAEVVDVPPESIAPYTLRLVRSADVFAHMADLLRAIPVEWLQTTARSFARRDDKLYEVVTDAGTIHASWVFDSALEVAPTFPSPHQPQALLSGTGVRVKADRAVFDATTATLFDPLDERSFAYLLPLSPAETLLESASFGSAAQEEDQTTLLQYLRARHPQAHFRIIHVESGSIPLGFAPSQTTGPQHILIGAKRGLIKPSAGYGVVRIAKESEHLARLWRADRPLPPSWQSSWQWRLLDKGFLQLAADDPRRPLALLRRTMHAIPLAQTLRFIDEELPPRQLAWLLPSIVPAVFRKP